MTMRAKFLALLAGLALPVAACSDGDANEGGSPPDDFLVVYQWREGSLPPPHHYEYSVEIHRDGVGVVTMMPDYEFNAPPKWTESVALEPEAIDRLYAALMSAHLASTNWKEDPRPPVGGGSGSLSVTLDGRNIEVPSFVSSGQRKDQESLAEAVRAAVPGALWEKLESMRQDYIATRSK